MSKSSTPPIDLDFTSSSGSPPQQVCGGVPLVSDARIAWHPWDLPIRSNAEELFTLFCQRAFCSRWFACEGPGWLAMQHLRPRLPAPARLVFGYRVHTSSFQPRLSSLHAARVAAGAHRRLRERCV